MSFAVQIDVRDAATPAVQRLINGLTPAQINPVVGRAARNVYVGHFRTLNSTRANQLGGARTNFYAKAASATHVRTDGEFVIISINKVGIAQRFFGGTIKPRNGKKYLTIPARSEAHGKNAGDFTNLEVLIGRDGPYALAITQGTVRKNSAGKRKDGSPSGLRLGDQASIILFWLKKEVTQLPDETVLPNAEEVGAQVVPAVVNYATRLWERSGGQN